MKKSGKIAAVLGVIAGVIFIFAGVINLIDAFGGFDTSKDDDSSLSSSEITTPQITQSDENGEAVESIPGQNNSEANNPVETSDVINPSPAESLSIGKYNALRAAEQYLSVMAFSRQGLIDQLEFSGYETADAEFAADTCGADWNEQAIKQAKNYLDTMAFSQSGLIDQLEFGGFTTEQAEYGVSNCGADWNEQAAIKAKSYLDMMAFSDSQLRWQLEFEGFSAEQIDYALESVGY